MGAGGAVGYRTTLDLLRLAKAHNINTYSLWGLTVGFETVPSWHKTQTKKWQISGGPAVAVAYGAALNVMYFRFHHVELGKTYPFVYAGLGVGLSFSVDLGKFLSPISQATDQAANTSGNPLSIKGLDKTTVLRPFSFFDLVGARGGVFQASVAAAASTGVKFWQFRGPQGYFVRYEGPAVEVKLAVASEPLNLTAGGLYPVDLEFQYVRKEEFTRMRDTRPSQNFNFNPGKA